MPAVIGLDIGNSSYRAVEVSSKKAPGKSRKIVLEKALTYNIRVDKDSNKSAENLREFIKTSGFSTKDAVLSLPESSVFSTILSLPFKTEKEIKSYIEIQGGKIFPRPLAELVYSFQILNPGERNKGGLDVNVVACDKERVEGLYKKARRAGLKVIALEPEAYSIVRALMRGQGLQPNEALLVVNMGSIDANTMVIGNGLVRFSRNVPLGGEVFNKAISQALGVTDEQAEEYKRTYGLEGALLGGKVRDALKPVADTLINEIKRTMNFYSTRNAFCEFKKVVYSGGSAVMPGLLGYSAESLGTEVEVANPFANMEFSSRLSGQKENLINLGPAYTVAAGLALREMP